MKRGLNYNFEKEVRRRKREKLSRPTCHALHTIFASSPWKLLKLQDRLARSVDNVQSVLLTLLQTTLADLTL